MTFKNCDIYLSRLISALCLFLILAEANTWLDPINNTALVLGYRLFILITPILFLFFKHRLTFIAFILSELGILCWLSNYCIMGTILFSVGISVSGYMLKYYSSFSAKGAAGNKIALNLGSIFSGILVALTHNIHLLLIFICVAMLISLFSFIKYYHRENISLFYSSATHFKLNGLLTRAGIAWMMIGFVTGVKLISLVSILPQFILSTHHGILPSWYGIMLILNSIIIVFLQMPIIKKIGTSRRITAIIPLGIAMLIIMSSAALGIGSCVNACIWTVSLSFIECAISYLDTLSQNDGALLLKEAAVGIGSAATVFCVRFFDLSHGSFIIGFVASLLLIISIFLFKSDLEPKQLSIA